METGNPADSKKKFYLVIGMIAVLYALALGLLSWTWYSKQFSFSFQFFDDLAEWNQMDKWGHLFASFQASAIASRLFLWTRYYDEKKSRRTGTIVAFLIVSSIEIPDGFSERYGASWYDIAANGIGCLAFLFQYLLWGRIKIFSKFSAHLTSFATLNPSLLGDNIFHRLLKDYNGQTYWFSVHLHFIRLPSWLCLSIGVGADGMIRGRPEQNELLQLNPYRKYFISLDINLHEIKTRSRLLNSILFGLNMIKIPAPAIELSARGIRFHAIYF
jgi:Predicted periplasmic lipoprotein (DUF2279)